LLARWGMAFLGAVMVPMNKSTECVSQANNPLLTGACCSTLRIPLLAKDGWLERGIIATQTNSFPPRRSRLPIILLYFCSAALEVAGPIPTICRMTSPSFAPS
jgi:hypothetical protein